MSFEQHSTAKVSEAGAPMPVLGPDNAPLKDSKGKPVIVYLRSRDSQSYRAKQHEMTNAALTRRNKKVTAQQIEAQAVELMVACGVGWEGIEDSNDKPVKFSPEKFEEYLTKEGFEWFREQVDEFINNRANFLGK